MEIISGHAAEEHEIRALHQIAKAENICLSHKARCLLSSLKSEKIVNITPASLSHAHTFCRLKPGLTKLRSPKIIPTAVLSVPRHPLVIRGAAAFQAGSWVEWFKLCKKFRGRSISKFGTTSGCVIWTFRVRQIFLEGDQASDCSRMRMLFHRSLAEGHVMHSRQLFWNSLLGRGLWTEVAD